MNTYLKLIISIGIPLLVGFISSIFTIDAIQQWYPTLQKPIFTPPNWVFGPAWTVLYISMGVSFFMIWKKIGKIKFSQPYFLYAIQLLLNFLWSFFFFYLENISLSLFDIILLWILVLWMIQRFWEIKKIAGLILLPYLFWISFATALNIGILILNV